MKKIALLMATYNGGAFIEAQLDSLLGQTMEDWQLVVRDDGSDDDTVGKIRSYAAKDKRILLQNDDSGRLGASRSYFKLLEHGSGQADYFMFCDQDDVWLPDKIEVTLLKMREMEKRFNPRTPLLVHTDLSVADRNLRVLAPSLWASQKLDPAIVGLNRLLIQNNVTGCTMMINRPLAALAAPPAPVIMHDWWLALVASAFGAIGHVPRSTIVYRQHGTNDTGAKRYDYRYIAHKVTRGRKEMHASLAKTWQQACVMRDRFAAELDPEQLFLLNRYCGIGEENFFMRRFWVLRLGTYKNGFFRNMGMMAAL
jgi:glycosyltransferase involved in cell wall biosynthesis